MSADWQADVAEFMRAMAQAVPAKPTIVDGPTHDLRLALIEEELDELREAMDAERMVGIADALVDLLYVTIGTACAYGLDLAPIWDAVQAANMAKVGGPVRDDGKRLKPPGWQPPDVERELRAQGWNPHEWSGGAA